MLIFLFVVRNAGANPKYLSVFRGAPASEFLEIQKLEDECSYRWEDLFNGKVDFKDEYSIPTRIPPAQVWQSGKTNLLVPLLLR